MLLDSLQLCKRVYVKRGSFCLFLPFLIKFDVLFKYLWLFYDHFLDRKAFFARIIAYSNDL